MPTRLVCPHCSAKLRLNEDLPENSKIGCSRCGKSFQTHTNPNKQAPPQLSGLMNMRLVGGVGAAVVGVLVLCMIFVSQIRSSDSEKPVPTEETPNPIAKADESKPAEIKPAPPIDPRIEAERLALEAEQKKRRDFGRLMQQGSKHVEAGRLKEAETDFTEAMGLFPDSREARDQLDKLAAMAARKKPAEEMPPQPAEQVAVEDKPKVVPPDDKPVVPAAEDAMKKQLAFESWMENGRKALAENKTRATLTAFKAALAIQPDDPQAKLETERVQKGIDTLEKAADLLKTKQFRAALKEYDAFRALFPRDVEGIRARDKAAKDYLNAIERYKVQFGQAHIALRNNQLEFALKLLTSAAETFPEAPEGPAAKFLSMSKQVESYVNQDYFEKAVELLTEAAETFPKSKEVTRSLASAKSQLEAIKKNAEASVTSGDNSLAQNAYEEAESKYRRAISVYPEGKDARQKLEQMRATDGYIAWNKERERLAREERERKEREEERKERDKERDKERQKELDKERQKAREKKEDEEEERKERERERREKNKKGGK